MPRELIERQAAILATTAAVISSAMPSMRLEMTILARTREALAADPARFIRYALGGSFGHGLKGTYWAVMHGDREVLQTTQEATDQFARSGVVTAGPYQQDAGCYDFRQN